MRFAGSQISNFMDTSNFDEISKASMKGRTQERMYDAQATGIATKAGIDAEGLIQRAKYGASSTRAQGSAAGQSAMWGGISSGIGNLAMGAANMPKSTKAPKTPGAPGLGDGFNLGENQAGLDPGVDLDPYLLSSPFSSISA